jgi:dihydrofolate reductase
VKLSIIAAMGKNREIGYMNQVPWYLPEDLAWFKKITGTNTVIMGRKTFENSVHKALVNRPNIVVSSKMPNIENVEVYSDLPSVFFNLHPKKEHFFIGGLRIYEQVIPDATTLYLTIVDVGFKTDRYFPDYSEFVVVDETNHEQNSIKYKHLILERPPMKFL